MTVTQTVLLWRHPGLTRDAFVERYETAHKLIGEDVLAGYAVRYVRRFLVPADGGDDGPDVITEITYPDRATMDACRESLQRPDVLARIVADEEQQFDRSRTRVFVVEECESAMPPAEVTRGESFRPSA